MSCGGGRSLTSRSTTCELRSNKRSALFTASYRVLLRFWETNPLAEGDSELLLAVLAVDRSYWQAHVDELVRVNLIADNVIRACEYIREPLKRFKLDTFA